MLSKEEKIELTKKADELIEASYYEGSECGEWWLLIAGCLNNIINSSIASDELVNAVIEEFNITYDIFLEECEWVEETVIQEKKIKALKWKNE